MRQAQNTNTHALNQLGASQKNSQADPISKCGSHSESGCIGHYQIIHFHTAKKIQKQATVLLFKKKIWNRADCKRSEKDQEQKQNKKWTRSLFNLIIQDVYFPGISSLSSYEHYFTNTSNDRNTITYFSACWEEFYQLENVILPHILISRIPPDRQRDKFSFFLSLVFDKEDIPRKFAFYLIKLKTKSVLFTFCVFLVFFLSIFSRIL